MLETNIPSFHVVAITIAALGAVGVTTAIMSSETSVYAQAQGRGGECHNSGPSGLHGSLACTGPSPTTTGFPTPIPSPFVCNRGHPDCHSVGP